MARNLISWERNRGGTRLFLEVIIVIILLFIPLSLLIIVLDVPAVPVYAGGLILSVLAAIVFASVVPFRIGVTDSDVIFRRFLGRNVAVMRIQEIVRVQYLASPGNHKKPLKRQLYTIVLEGPYNTRIRGICDGPVARRLVAVLPREKSRLLIMTFGGTVIEEKTPSI